MKNDTGIAKHQVTWSQLQSRQAAEPCKWDAVIGGIGIALLFLIAAFV